MVIIVVMVMFAVFIVGEWFFLRYMDNEKKKERCIQNMQQATETQKFYHPGHTWIISGKGDIVEVGMDSFSQKIIGKVDKVEFPKEGQIIRQGSPLWTMVRGSRQLVQVSPISGKIVEINQDVQKDPGLATQPSTGQSWLIKVLPFEMSRNLNNLFTEPLARKWEEWSKNQFVMRFTSINSPIPVCQDGGELRDDISLEIPDTKWEQIQYEFFYPPYCGKLHQKGE